MIITDTREQLPLFKRDTIRKKLCVGDYSHMMLEHCFSIERKSPNDLYGTLLKGHVRFRKELIRAKHYGIKLVVYVECSKKKFLSMKWPGGKFLKCPPATLEKIIDTMSFKYDLEFVWCSSRTVMCRKVKQRLALELSAIAKTAPPQTRSPKRSASQPPSPK